MRPPIGFVLTTHNAPEHPLYLCERILGDLLPIKDEGLGELSFSGIPSGAQLGYNRYVGFPLLPRKALSGRL